YRRPASRSLRGAVGERELLCWKRPPDWTSLETKLSPSWDLASAISSPSYKDQLITVLAELSPFLTVFGLDDGL
ncbi:hypothetical protein E2I00_002984, partial [Balaenoptera physalus]